MFHFFDKNSMNLSKWILLYYRVYKCVEDDKITNRNLWGKAPHHIINGFSNKKSEVRRWNYFTNIIFYFGDKNYETSVYNENNFFFKRVWFQKVSVNIIFYFGDKNYEMSDYN